MKVNNLYDVTLEITTSMVKSFDLEMDEEGKVTKLMVEIELPRPMKVKSNDRVWVDTFNHIVKNEGWTLFTISNKECEDLKEYCLYDKYFMYGSNWYLDRSKCD